MGEPPFAFPLNSVAQVIVRDAEVVGRFPVSEIFASGLPARGIRIPGDSPCQGTHAAQRTSQETQEEAPRSTVYCIHGAS